MHGQGHLPFRGKCEVSVWGFASSLISLSRRLYPDLKPKAPMTVLIVGHCAYDQDHVLYIEILNLLGGAGT